MPIFPLGVWYSFIGLCLRYYVDKYGLLRRWAPLPPMGAKMMSTSIGFMAFTAVVAMVMAQRYYAAWPFDNVCGAPADSPYQYTYCNRGALGNKRLFWDNEPHMPEQQRFAADLRPVAHQF